MRDDLDFLGVPLSDCDMVTMESPGIFTKPKAN